MNNEERLIEVMAELLSEVHAMRTEFTGEVKGLRNDVQQLQKEQVSTNLSIKELRLSVVKLSDELIMLHNHEGRLVSLEKEVFKRAS